MSRKTLLVLAVASAVFSLAACNKGTEPSKNSASASASATAKTAEKADKIIIANEDILNLQSNALASGPVITGSIQPERKADLRAEVSTIVLQVLKENGEPVKRGDVIVKLDETAIRDNLNSANDAVRNASLALDQAERNLQRLKTLRASGMTSMQSLDDAEVRRNAAQSEVSSAKARAAAAQQQLARTVVRAPFDGVISERKVSAGDTAAAGKELVKVIDPNSMRFVGRVSADKIGVVKPGQSVSFRINGYAGQEFRGKITRVDPAANDVTRQVEVLVAFSDSKQPKVSGLYAEGTVEAETVAALMLPEAAIVKAGDKSYAWKVNGKTLNKVELALGSRDARTGNYEIRKGVAAGDIIMRNPNSNLKDGQTVEMAAALVTKQVAMNTIAMAEGN